VRPALLGFLLLAACGTNPRKDFDAGVVLHFILVRERPPEADVTMEPVFTVGDRVVRAPAITFGPDHALAQEAAVLRVPRVDGIRMAMWDPTTRTEARDTVDTRHELWIVVDIQELGGSAGLELFRRPPNEELPDWVPLAEMTN